MVLLGRYFRVPYWRVLPGSKPDLELIEAYRATLERGEAPEDLRLLLFAHGLEIDFSRYTFSLSEVRAVNELKERLGLPVETSDIDLAMHLWLNVPFSRQDSRLCSLRSHLRSESSQPPGHRAAVSYNSMLSMISQLRPGQELLLPIYFDYDLSLLSEPAKNRIGLFIEALVTSGRFDDDDWWIELRGHSDERGNPVKNQELSERRAARVGTHLEQEHSVPADRIVSAGFGSTELVNENATTEEEHSQNRRVEILLVINKPADASSQETEAPAD